MEKRIVLVVALATALVGVAGRSNAGLVQDPGPVAVDSTDGFGGMGAAYLSGDGVQYIGCQISGNASGSLASCFATAPNGASASCATSGATEVAKIVQVLSALSPDAVIDFTVAGDGTCASVTLLVASTLAPKKLGD